MYWGLYEFALINRRSDFRLGLFMLVVDPCQVHRVEPWGCSYIGYKCRVSVSILVPAAPVASTYLHSKRGRRDGRSLCKVQAAASTNPLAEKKLDRYES